MFTMGTQFDLTEEGVEALQRYREVEDLSILSPEVRNGYMVLTLLDMEGLMDYQGLLEAMPRRVSPSDVSDALKRLGQRGWITTEWSDLSFRKPTSQELDQVKGREERL